MSIRLVHGCAVLLLAAFPVAAVAAPPAPQATARANGIKQLRFDWGTSAGATRYELWFRASANATPSRFFQMPSTQRSVINNVSVHLLDWTNARYWVNACDSTGCTSSNLISVVNLMPDTIGLFTAQSQQPSSELGREVAISGDGATLAVTAPREPSNDLEFPKGSVYLYRRSGGAWAFEASIPFDVSRGGRLERSDIALSGNGNVLAIGLPGDKPHGDDTGIGTGSVNVFRFVVGNGWRHDATIAQQTGFELFSSDQVELDQTGRTLAVKTELGGSGVFIYTYTGAGSWSHTGTVVGHGAAPENGENCGRFALSADGNVIARNCSAFYPTDINIFEVYAAPGWGVRDTIPMPAGRILGTALSASATGDALAIFSVSTSDTSDRSVEIYRRANGAYQREASLRRGAWNNAATTFGNSAQFSGDGRLLAIGDAFDRGAGVGALAPPLAAGSAATGAVYVFEQRSSGWNLRRMVKPGRAGAGFAAGSFGGAIAFGDNGKALVVGQPAANNNTGVVWLY